VRCVAIKADGVLVVEERPTPSPGPGEVLVAVKAAGLNAADLLQRRGFYPAPAGSPADIPGLELAGEVEALGDGATRFAVGDRVMAVVGGGGQATHLVVHERLLMSVPATITWEEAGGFPEAFVTAHDALFTQCGLAMGERVCVHGAAGGVGTAGVQIAHAAGAHVTATVRDTSRHEEVRALGADVVITPDEFAATSGYDVILELVGAPNWPANVEALANRGRIAVIGIGAGAKVELNLGMLMGRRAQITGSTQRARPLEDKALATRRVEKSVLPGFASGDLCVFVAATYPLEEAAAAYERFRQGAKFGKIVLVV
jgi:putative PIG3 family NAD(P)H quinone oxidoreductase